MLVKLLSKLPTPALIRILLASRNLMTAAATHFKNRANKKLLDNWASYNIHLFTVQMYKDLNIQKPIEKPKFLQEVEADRKEAARCEGWIRKIDEAVWQYEVAKTFSSK